MTENIYKFERTGKEKEFLRGGRIIFIYTNASSSIEKK
jgi:hypothetical protein